MNSEIVISGKKCSTLKRVFMKIIIANALGWIVYVLGTFADSIIGGSFLGEEALAAIEIIAPLSSIIYFLSYLVSLGCSIKHAKYIGKNDFEAADCIYSSSFIFSVLIGIISAVLLYVFKETWLDLYELEGTIREYASDYYDPFILVALITPVGMLIYNCVVSDGGHLYVVASDILQSGVNIALSLLLVGTLGTKGLSIATLVGIAVSYCIPGIRLFTKSSTLHLKLKFTFKDIKDSIRIGSSSFITILAVAVIDIIMNLYITKTYGASYTATYAIVNFALEISSALGLVGQTMLTLISFSVGEDNTLDTQNILSFAKKLAIIVGLAFAIVFICLTPVWPDLFGLETQEFINYTKVASIAIGITFIIQPFFYMITSFNTAYERMYVSISANVMNSFVLPLVCPIVLSALFGYNGFVVGFAVSNVLACAIIYIFLYIKNNRKVFLIPETDSKMYSIDLNVDSESISKATIQLRDILQENKISSIISNRIQLTIEESLLITMKNNQSKKISARIVIDINSERVKLIVKDSGKIFNVVDPDQKINDLSNYVFVMTTSKSNKAINYVASNLNGNHYEFELKA